MKAKLFLTLIGIFLLTLTTTAFTESPVPIDDTDYKIEVVDIETGAVTTVNIDNEKLANEVLTVHSIKDDIKFVEKQVSENSVVNIYRMSNGNLLKYTITKVDKDIMTLDPAKQITIEEAEKMIANGEMFDDCGDCIDCWQSCRKPNGLWYNKECGGRDCDPNGNN